MRARVEAGLPWPIFYGTPLYKLRKEFHYINDYLELPTMNRVSWNYFNIFNYNWKFLKGLVKGIKFKFLGIRQ